MIGSHQNYAKQRFANLKQPSASVADAEFDDAIFEHCQFNEVTFSHCRFSDCRFIGCDLSLSRFANTRIAGCRFETTKLVGIDWTLAERTAHAALVLQFKDCKLDLGSFFGLNLRGSTFLDSSAKEVDLTEADLRDCSLRGTDLTGAKFHGTNLEGADLVGAMNYTIDPSSNRVRNARFALPEAVSLLRGLGVKVEWGVARGAFRRPMRMR